MADSTPHAADSITDHPPYKPADDQEVIYFEGSPNLRGNVSSLFWNTLAAVALLALIFCAYSFSWSWWSHWFTIICLVAAIIIVFMPFLITRTIHFRISSYRIDFERGLFSRNVDTLELWHIDDISYNQSLLDRILKVGTITVVSNDKSTPRLEMYGLPKSRPIFDALKQRVIQVKRQRGVIKMDIG